LHAHDFRDALEFKDKDVLIVGRSYSAEDIGSQCYKYGARSVTATYRSKPMGFKWPAGFEEVPLLQRVENKTAFFKDGTSREVDAIILARDTNITSLPPDVSAFEDGKSSLAAWPLQRSGMGSQSKADVPGHAGPVTTLSICLMPKLGLEEMRCWGKSRCPLKSKWLPTAPVGAREKKSSKPKNK
jgi:hypothetical protein